MCPGRPLKLMGAGMREAPPPNFQPQPREVKLYVLAGFRSETSPRYNGFSIRILDLQS
ncbi:hypothetical protein J6590_087845 [Homalodisca vitripennis]|nr:hypothetical protein J6590_087845 [Homalodisca vitripennis]